MGGTRLRWVLALGAVMMAMLPARDAVAFGHRGGGFHHGGFGFRVGFGFGCCWGGPWYPPYYGYPAYAYPAAYYPPSYAYPTGYVSPPSYVSPASPASYVNPAPAAPAAADCREYRMAATIGGRPETIVGLACRQPDGSWRPTGR